MAESQTTLPLVRIGEPCPDGPHRHTSSLHQTECDIRKEIDMDDQPQTTVSFSHHSLSRLIWLCEEEAKRLQKFAEEHASDPDSEDDVADADNDGTYWRLLATMLREKRDA